MFGSLLCLDGFLYNFTILPIRSIFATARIVSNAIARKPILPIPPTHLLSILRMLLLFIPTVILLVATDASKMYHTVRGQDTIKLYVIFNALEVGLLYLSYSERWLMIDCRSTLLCFRSRCPRYFIRQRNSITRYESLWKGSEETTSKAFLLLRPVSRICL